MTNFDLTLNWEQFTIELLNPSKRNLNYVYTNPRARSSLRFWQKGLGWPYPVRSALKRTPAQDFNSFSIMFYHIISATYQKIGDLFCPVHISGLLHSVQQRVNFDHLLTRAWTFILLDGFHNCILICSSFFWSSLLTNYFFSHRIWWKSKGIFLEIFGVQNASYQT